MRNFSLSLFLLPLFGWSQAPSKALLWKVDGQGLSHASYVVGTVHSRDARAFGQVPQLLEVIHGLDGVAGELDLTSTAEASMELAMAMMMPPGTTLADLYSKRKLKRVQDAVSEHLGAMAMMAERLKPFFLMSLLSESVMRADSAMVLDQYLQVKAKEMGKEVLGIETMQEQLAAVNDLPLQEQADMLYQLVQNDLYLGDMDGMMEAYAAQDLDRLTKIVSLGGLPDGFSARLLTDRNKVMAERADSLMQEGSTLLFALGAGHLPGADGVLERLRRMGYAVEPVLDGVTIPAQREPAKP